MSARESARQTSAPQTSVYVLEDDYAMRDAMAMLLRSAGHRVHAFATPAEFLDGFAPSGPCCVVLDVRMPQMSGPRVQDELLQRGFRVPVVFVTGHADVPTAVGTMRKGALDFLEKPFDPARFLEVVQEALALASSKQAADLALTSARTKFDALTERERAVLGLVLDGMPNRLIAETLHISVKTVEFHRAHIMRKLEVDTAAELVRFCVESKLVPPAL